MNEVIDAADYRIIKLDCESKIKALESQLGDIPKNAVTGEDVINVAVTALSQIEILYQTDNMERKRMVVGSLFPEKLWFDGVEHRTARMNDGARVMFQINNELRKKKRRASNDFSYLPTWVLLTGLDANSHLKYVSWPNFVAKHIALVKNRINTNHKRWVLYKISCQ